MAMRNLPQNTSLDTLLIERRNDVQTVTQLEQTRLIGRNVTTSRQSPSAAGLTDNDRVGDVFYGTSELFMCVADEASVRKWKKITWTDV